MPKPSTYPPPLIIPPSSHPHKTTLIILHGRGSTSAIFAPSLLSHLITPSSSSSPQSTLPSLLPHTKLIFPTASLNRAIPYNRSLTHQWFDNYPLDTQPPEYRQHIQTKGLKESVGYLHGIIGDAVKEVGAAGNVVVMGLSQGCATVLCSGLLWEGESLGGVVGICGWLPFRESLLDGLDGGEGEDEEGDDLFERGEEGGKEEEERVVKAQRLLREELDMDGPVENGEKVSIGWTPIFIGHGKEDEKVPFELGKLAASFLGGLGLGVRFREYKGLGHWYSADMLRDIVAFIKDLDGWKE